MKKIKIVTVFVLLFIGSSGATGQARTDFTRNYREAYEAYRQGEYQRALEINRSTLKITPCHPIIIYNIACMYAMLEEPDEAIDWLSRYAEIGSTPGVDITSETDFDSIRETQEFKDLLNKIESNSQPVLHSEEAFRIPEKDLIPEGIAYDPKEETFYFGSTYKSKIVRMNQDGVFSDFTGEKQDGLRSVLGMRVDAERRILWANSVVSSPRTKDYDPVEQGWACVFKYDLHTGKLIRKYGPIGDGYDHILNDLVLAEEGDVYVTDMNTGEIYWISHKSDTLELFIGSDAFMYLNGIALSSDESKIYVADSGNQIFVVDLKTKEFHALPMPEFVTTYGIDGLYFYKNSLIGVQNQMGRVVRFFLDASGNKILRMETIEANNPLFQQIPTTGVVVDSLFYFMANTQIRSFNQDNSIFPTDQLEDVVVLRYRLE